MPLESRWSAVYDIKTSNLMPETYFIPDDLYDAVALLDSREFTRVLDALSCLSKSVLITANAEGLQFEVFGSAGHGNIFFPVYIGEYADNGLNFSKRSADKHTVRIAIKKRASVLLSLHYLSRISKAGIMADEVCLKLSNDMPCAVSDQCLLLLHDTQFT